MGLSGRKMDGGRFSGKGHLRRWSPPHQVVLDRFPWSSARLESSSSHSESPSESTETLSLEAELRASAGDVSAPKARSAKSCGALLASVTWLVRTAGDGAWRTSSTTLD